MERLALTIAQAAKLGGPCRSALYEDIRSGRLRAVKRGRSTRILIDDFKAYLASLPPIPPADKEITVQPTNQLMDSASGGAATPSSGLSKKPKLQRSRKREPRTPR
jgi:excisionase family DNA binding protein